MIPVQQYTFTIPAGGAFPQQCMGRYFRIQAASGTLKVVGDNFGNMGLLAPGQGLRMREKDQPFQRLTFIDTSGAANNVTVIVADSDFIDNTLLGTVSVVDGVKALVLANTVFMFTVLVSAVAAQVPVIMLLNPAGSGKRLILKSVSYSCDTAGAVIRAGQYNSAAAWPAKLGNGFSKLIPAGAGVPQAAVGEIYGTNFAPGGGMARNYESVMGAVNTTMVRTYEQPVVLQPGAGWVIDTNTANSGLLGALQWQEEAIV